MNIENEAFSAVRKLNNDSYFNEMIEHINLFIFESNGDSCLIKFCDTVIWCSEDDEREDLPGIDQKENLINFLLKEAKKVAKDIQDRLLFFDIENGNVETDGYTTNYDAQLIREFVEYIDYQCTKSGDECIISNENVEQFLLDTNRA